MRITQNMLNNTMMSNLNNSLNHMDRLQDMLATGKKISKPSHDPVIASMGMLYRTSLKENEQFRSNTDSAVDWLNATESGISEAGSALSRIKELVTQASNDTLNQGDREKVCDEIMQLRDHLGTVANTTLSGRYIFSGTSTETAPFKDRMYINKNDADIKYEMSQAILIPVNVNGIQLFGQQATGVPDAPVLNPTGAPGSTKAEQDAYNDGWKTDLFATMNKLIEELRPSEFATDMYGRVLAADSTTGAPMIDPANGKAVLYTGASGQAKLKNEGYVTNNKGQLLAADKVTGEPVFDTSTPSKVKLYDPADASQLPLKKNTNASGQLLGYDKTDTTGAVIVINSNNTNHVALYPALDKTKPTTGKALTGYLSVLQKHVDNFLQIQAEVGSRVNRINLIQDRLDNQKQSTEDIMSMGEDADMAQVITDLQNNENVHRAALAAGSRIIQPTLLDFLR